MQAGFSERSDTGAPSVTRRVVLFSFSKGQYSVSVTGVLVQTKYICCEIDSHEMLVMGPGPDSAHPATNVGHG